MRRLFSRLASRLGPVLQSDTAFIAAAYRDILRREVDPEGLSYYRRVLREGSDRTAVLLALTRSEEYTNRLVRHATRLSGLRLLRPEQFRQAVDVTCGDTVMLFEVRSPADFDWLESQILENHYYEKPGVWTLDIDRDKRVIAEIVGAFAARKALELGCAAGAVLQCLHEEGIAAEGVEISSMAIARAPEAVRGRIHHGDLLSLALPAPYDLIFGLDIYEHLNPNRLDAYLQRLADLTCPGGHLFCNIPAFGEDPVFGTVFPLYVTAWQRDAAANRPFTLLHVDDDGYPIHGHLTWAESRWWVERFEAHGFRREPEIERALHRKYDDYMRKHTPARVSYYVFAKDPSPDRRAAIVGRIGRPSKVVG
jgi:2-polyprenyl-3-methyl-5-hydroxy-6-metoxy-1,4-benzoquinol methylase